MAPDVLDGFPSSPLVAIQWTDSALFKNQAAQGAVVEAKMFKGNYINAIRDYPGISFFHTCEPRSDV